MLSFISTQENLKMEKFAIKANIFHALSVSMAKNDVRYYLNGIYIDGNKAVSTDGHRITIAKLDETIPAKIIIPGDQISIALKNVKKDGIIWLCLEDNKWHLGAAGLVLPFTPIDARYPDYRRVVHLQITPPTTLPLINPDYYGDIQKIIKNTQFETETKTKTGIRKDKRWGVSINDFSTFNNDTGFGLYSELILHYIMAVRTDKQAYQSGIQSFLE